jgi:hypothetical protein
VKLQLAQVEDLNHRQPGNEHALHWVSRRRGAHRR